MRSLLLLLALILTANSSDAAVWFVDNSNTSGNDDGTSWATAFTTIQPAIDAAFADGGGDVWIAAGVYDETRTSIMHDPPLDTGSLVLKENVHLFGGFAGNETEFAQRNLSANPTVIDGSRSRGGQPANHVVVGATGASLDGFTIQGGRASDDVHARGGEDDGAGLLNDGGPIEIRNCVFQNNEAPSGSGSAVSTTHPITVAYSSFFSNSDSSVISVSGVTITIENCVFRDNGGGSCVSAGGNFGNVFVSDSLFESNEGISNGGISVAGGIILCDRTRFHNNRATGTNGAGSGAIAVVFGDATIRNCAFTENRSDAVPFNPPTQVSAGAIGNFDADLTVINSTFWGNTSAAGVGAIDAIGDTVVVNSIFWNNDETAIRTRDGFLDFVAFSDVQGRESEPDEPGNIDADPLFVDPANRDFRIQTGSPVIDAAMAQVSVGFINVAAPDDDILGVPRPFGAEVDMGAYEFQGELQLCALFPDISQQFDQFLVDFGLMEIDPGDGLPATGSLALIETASCFLDESLTQATDSAFLTNRAALMAEPDFPKLMAYEDLIPALMLASTEMQAAVRSILSSAGLSLTGDYFTVRCSSSEICTTAPPPTPKTNALVVRPSWLLHGPPAEAGRMPAPQKAAFQEHSKGPVTPTPDHEPYSGAGDPDQDGKTNAEEWDEIVVMNGGTPSTFARAALGIAASGGSSSSCFIATAVYGTPLAHQIQPLRTFRDNHLLTNPLGTALTDLYYRLSPPLADHIANDQTLRGIIRHLLNVFR